MKRDEAKAKISKLLALSSSPNEHEARVALKKAQQLMLEFGISECETQDSGVGKRKIKYWTGMYCPREAQVISYLSKEYMCMATNDISDDGKYAVLTLFGSEADIDIAEAALTFAYKTFCSCWKSYWKQLSDYEKKRKGRKDLRIDYCIGFKDGIKAANKDNRDEYGLVLVARKEVVDECKSYDVVKADNYKQLGWRLVTPKEKVRYMDHNAYTNGKESGKHVRSHDQITNEVSNA